MGLHGKTASIAVGDFRAYDSVGMSGGRVPVRGHHWPYVARKALLFWSSTFDVCESGPLRGNNDKVNQISVVRRRVRLAEMRHVKVRLVLTLRHHRR